jgi:hypothetical protein
MKKVVLGFLLVITYINCWAEISKAPNNGIINKALPIHQLKKLNPELSDPVLGDQAQITEWAWSPEYAQRFGQREQRDGLLNGDLWLVGIKVERKQFQNQQRYICSVMGLMKNNLPIIAPPSDIYLMHPDSPWVGGMPGIKAFESLKVPKDGSFAPAVAVWFKRPKNKSESTLPERGLGFPYKYYYKYFHSDLAYFEWQAGCGSFNDPNQFRNEIRFPARIDGKNDSEKGKPAVFENSAIHFDIPDGLMHRVYPYLVEAEDWSSCFLSRTDEKKFGLTDHAIKSKRFVNKCVSNS